MTLIDNESNLAKNYIFDKDKDGLVELTLKNAALAEAIFKNDSRYSKSEDINNGPNEGKSYGTAAYWITQLSDILLKNNNLSADGYDYKTCLENTINAIDRENSTRLNADKAGRGEILNRILKISKINKNDLIQSLKYPQNNNYDLIVTINKEIKIPGVSKKGRENFSFATKFCHFMCFYLFKGQPEQDNFSIYDNVLAEAIPKYHEKYCGNKVTIEKDYEKYIKYIDEIRKCAKEKHHEEISRNAFDHLLWFSHKG